MIDIKGLMIMALLVGVAAIAVVIAIMLDLASGLRKANLRGEARRSYAYERTTTKLMRNGSLVLIMAMTSVEDIENYDITQGYPQKLNLSTEWLRSQS